MLGPLGAFWRSRLGCNFSALIPILILGWSKSRSEGVGWGEVGWAEQLLIDILIL